MDTMGGTLVEQVHEHHRSDGTALTHETGHVHAHNHTHTHTQTKAVLNRMSRLIGHMESIKKMVEDGRDCSEVLVQLSAVQAALQGVGKVILKDHIEHCIVDAIREGDEDALVRLDKAIDQFIR